MKHLDSDSLYLSKLTFDKNMLKSPMNVLINNVRLVMLAVIALIIAGAGAFNSLPRELNPEVDIPIVTVVTSLPGASPTDVEQLVTKPLEREISDLTTIDVLSSSSSNSVSVITIQFLSTENTDDAVTKVKEKVDLALSDLPDEANDPITQKLDFNEQPIWTVALVGDINRIALGEIAEGIQDKLENTTGIRRVDINGDEEQEITVELKPETLVTYGISAQAISQALTSNNLTLPAGTVQVNEFEYSVSLDNEFSDIDQVRALPIAVGNSFVQLSDVANVYYKSKDTTGLVFYRPNADSRFPAVELNIYKSDTATINDAFENAQRILDETTQANESVEYVSILNVADDVTQSFDDLTSNFRSTVLIVFFILLAFLGIRQASIASISIPLTFLSAFIIMNLMGITLNFLSLFSLLLALGLVVDDAIVIVQASDDYGKKFTPAQTGLMVYRDFVVPIWTTTLTTVWAFLPLLLATGIIGEFIKSIPIVVCATLLSSTTIAVLLNIPLSVIFANTKFPRRVNIFLALLVAVIGGVVVSTLTSGSSLSGLAILLYVLLLVFGLISRGYVRDWLGSLRGNKLTPAFAQPWIDKVKEIMPEDAISKGFIDFEIVARRYRVILWKIITQKRRRIQVYLAATAFVILSIVFLATGLLKNEFFPATDSENIYVNIEGPAGWNLDETREVLREVENMVVDTPYVDTIVSTSGSSFDPSGSGAGGSGSNYASIALSLAPKDDRPVSSMDLAADLREEFEAYTKANITIAELSGGPPTGADFQVNIKGEDLALLETISNDFMNILEEIEGTININTSLKLAPGEVNVRLLPTELQERGLSAVQVGGWLRTALSGSEASSITRGEDEEDITVRLEEEAQTLSYLQNLTLVSPTGTYQLAEIAELTLENAPVSIVREDKRRVVRVTAATQGVPSTQVLQEFQARLDEYDMPLGYTWDVGGANEENQRSVNSIIQAMGASVILILITMVLQLSSFRKAFLVISVIPLAVAGVFFNFTLFGIPLSFPALIGVLALFGIVVNNSIMLVEKINQNIKQGFETVDAVVDACSSRLEPIFLTSLTTSAGLLPITISDPLWRGLGGSIIAGLSVSGLLILFLLPALYVETFKDE